MTELEDAMAAELTRLELLLGPDDYAWFTRALIQEPLGAEFTAIWDANVDKLYES